MTTRRRHTTRMMAAALTVGLLAPTLGTPRAFAQRPATAISVQQGRTLFARFIRLTQRDEGACLSLHSLLTLPLLNPPHALPRPVAPAQRAYAVALGRRIMRACGRAGYVYGPADPQHLLRYEPLPLSVLYLLVRLSHSRTGYFGPWGHLWDSMPPYSWYCAGMYMGGYELTGDGDNPHGTLPEGYYADSRGDIWRGTRSLHATFIDAARSAGSLLHVAVPANW